MPRMQNYSEELPAAVISDRLLRQIDSAILNGLRDVLTLAWSADVGTTTIEENSIDAFMDAITDDEGFDGIRLEAYNTEEGISFTMSCESLGPSLLEYSCPKAREGQLAVLAHAIQGMFNAERRWTIGYLGL